MKGNVIGFDADANSGAISGYDGKRYDFAALDWHGAKRPSHGDLIDFVPQGQQATQIYLIEPEFVRPSLAHFYFSPSGRISRSQYWLHYILPVFVISVILSVISGIAQVNDNQGIAITFNFLYGLFSLLTLWPGIAVLIKRIHDRDKSGWLVLLPIVPVVLMIIAAIAGIAGGSIYESWVVIVTLAVVLVAIAIWFFVEFGCMRGTIGANRYGPDPVDER